MHVSNDQWSIISILLKPWPGLEMQMDTPWKDADGSDSVLVNPGQSARQSALTHTGSSVLKGGRGRGVDAQVMCSWLKHTCTF